ncbi:LPXTG cell wall anchor domain-containing protein [Streptomyces sp. SLBN-134]|uniref:LPXTG cell wall anchor domain-containing protein n=1 Tax=Streptomyces sp. SLBN-134 TaxID=2768456 RepID=UPI00114F5CB9|nr:LPXTG cell wall anchor domain-containing protein [Streptomyces sp. SLBN-134]TQL22209.1 hypothetical protein FBY37_4234 [Streptomyces sp. SLBN-134]
MTKKTRIRVARIAAGAVIAAGASLTAAGAASALDIGVSASASDEGLGLGVSANAGNEDDPGEEEPTPDDPPTTIPEEPPTEEPPTEQPPTEEPPTEEPPTDEPTEPTEEPTEPTEEPSENPGPGKGSGKDDGNITDPNGGASPQDEGSSALTDTGDEVPATSAQGNGKELAETGAAETTFLLIGAATMIAGGIGFRILPRLMDGRGGAAA